LTIRNIGSYTARSLEYARIDSTIPGQLTTTDAYALWKLHSANDTETEAFCQNLAAAVRKLDDPELRHSISEQLIDLALGEVDKGLDGLSILTEELRPH
jgi:hypothetical protein